MLLALKRRIYRHLLRDPHYAFLFDPPSPQPVEHPAHGLKTRPG